MKFITLMHDVLNGCHDTLSRSVRLWPNRRTLPGMGMVGGEKTVGSPERGTDLRRERFFSRKTPFLLLLLFTPAAMGNIPLIQMTQTAGAQEYSASLQILLLLTSLSFLPAVLLVMTSFTRIIIVLSLLRQALGVQQIPPNPILVGLALFLTLFIMQPVLDQVYVQAVEPYMNEQMTLKQAADVAGVPVREFMLRQTRESDLVRMLEIAGESTQISTAEIPFSVLIPSFILSELKTAFQIGFMLFIPFLVIDMVVASVLMAMGMMMLSPLVISLPFKLMLFVLADGWGMTVGTLAASFG